MAVVMLQPHQRDAAREHLEENIPVLEQAIEELKSLARKAKTRMLAISGAPVFVRAQDALNSLASPYFCSELTWGMDPASLTEARADIHWFQKQGHASIAYVLWIKLLQQGVTLTHDEIEKLLLCRQQFTQDMESGFYQTQSSCLVPATWKGCQMFMPKELCRIRTVAKQLLRDKRPDLLGRMSFHILADAGASIKWEVSHSADSCPSIHFETDDLSSIDWPIQAVDSADILGRTALHIAVRQGSMWSMLKLIGKGVHSDIHRLCLSNLSILHIAACHGHRNIVNHLIDMKVSRPSDYQYMHELDQLDSQKRTPFWYAARSSHIDVMNCLIEASDQNRFVFEIVDTEHEDVNGHSALAIAARDGRTKVLAHLFHLRKRICHLMIADILPHEHLLLAYAVQSRSRDCIKLVHEHRAWGSGGSVYQKAQGYALAHRDTALFTELHNVCTLDLQPAPGLLNQEIFKANAPKTTLDTLRKSIPLWSEWETWMPESATV